MIEDLERVGSIPATRSNLVSVPCGSCHLCCRLMTPILPEKGDNPKDYQTAICISPGKAPYMILDRRDNGDCIYLGHDGCTIHDHAPWTCRTFDCRDLFRNSDRPGRKLAVKRGEVAPGIFERGRELIEADKCR